jgi:hypothetical protein
MLEVATCIWPDVHSFATRSPESQLRPKDDYVGSEQACHVTSAVQIGVRPGFHSR